MSLDRTRILGLLSLGAFALGSTACGDGSSTPAGCDRYVTPGDDDRTTVQTMFEEAQDGETLCLGAGTYRFDDPIEITGHTGITIRGTGATRADVVLDFSMQGLGNSGLSASNMTDFRIEHVTVLDASGNDVFITDSDGVEIVDVSAGWVTRPMNMRGRYALYPVQSTDVLIEDSEAFGSSDAGFYVGQTTNCILRGNVGHDNVAGLEIENSINCEVVDNELYDNTAGILVFELPGLELSGHTTLVHDNYAHDNNLENFAEDGIVALVPTGIGVMILAANEVEVTNNRIEDNESLGVVVVSYTTPLALGAPEPMDPDYEPYVDSIWIHDNTYVGNGTAPWPPLTLILTQQTPPGTTLEDILFDGEFGPDAMDDLCVGADGTFRQADIGDTFMTQSTDRSPYACTGTAVPPVVL